ncbi:MAG: hypothetical protein M1502_03675 [Deltaproteobacteria bacterium]|jgi:hypothetical protein|nr:hypothetical protein [Deltaproteobacteria bacterium]
MAKISDFSMFEILQRGGIETAHSGNEIVCRCPVCKTGKPLSRGNHDAQINTETLYCFSEEKTYTRTEIIKKLNFWDILGIKKPLSSSSFAPNRKEKPVPTQESKKAVKKEEKKVIPGEIYNYCDMDGKVLYRRQRLEYADGSGKAGVPYIGKAAEQPTIFYGLETLQDPQSLNYIMLTEGAKCAEAVRHALAGTPATSDTAVLGFDNPREWEHIGAQAQEIILSKKIIIFQDNDKTGADNTAGLLSYIRKSATVVDFPDKPLKYDIANWLSKGGSISEAIKIYAKPVDLVDVLQNTKIIKKEQVEKPIMPVEFLRNFLFSSYLGEQDISFKIGDTQVNIEKCTLDKFHQAVFETIEALGYKYNSYIIYEDPLQKRKQMAFAVKFSELSRLFGDNYAYIFEKLEDMRKTTVILRDNRGGTHGGILENFFYVYFEQLKKELQISEEELAKIKTKRRDYQFQLKGNRYGKGDYLVVKLSAAFYHLYQTSRLRINYSLDVIEKKNKTRSALMRSIVDYILTQKTKKTEESEKSNSYAIFAENLLKKIDKNWETKPGGTKDRVYKNIRDHIDYFKQFNIEYNPNPERRLFIYKYNCPGVGFSKPPCQALPLSEFND